MPCILIPFSDFASGERAVRRLLARPRDPALDLELLAIVDPLTPGKVAVFVSPQCARAQATAAARDWLARLEAMLNGTGIRHRSRVATGRLRTILRTQALHRGIDEVLLGTRDDDPLRGLRRRAVAQAMTRPLASVS